MKLTMDIIPRNIGGSEMLTRKELLKLLHYDEFTGMFRWKVWRQRVKAGVEAGYVRVSGQGKSYRRITINGRHYYAHRLVVANYSWPIPRE